MSIHRLAGLAPLGLAAALLAGCATPTPYRPADKPGAEGYSETRVSENRYRVVFAGNTLTASGTVQDYALLRASELTLQQGYDWFELQSRNTDRRDEQHTDVSGGYVTPPTTSIRRVCGPLTCRDEVVYSPGFASPAVATTTTYSRYRTQLDVVMGKNPKPARAEAYDAREVAQNLRKAIPQAASTW